MVNADIIVITTFSNCMYIQVKCKLGVGMLFIPTIFHCKHIYFETIVKFEISNDFLWLKNHALDEITYLH